MNYSLWNKKDTINGKEASYFLEQKPFKDYEGDIILIYADNGKVSQIECKDILSSIYKIDKTLSLDEFMTQYETILNTPIETSEINENSEINETSN